MLTVKPLSGQVAFVQGGSRGIGAAIVKRLARDGAAVAFTYVSSASKAEELVATITAAGGKALAIRADSADAVAVQHAIRQSVTRFGQLDILVNNAGVLVWGHLEELTLDDLDRTLAVNIRSVFVACQEAAHHMGKGGRIINIGSTNADRIPMAGGSVYAMSKSAIIGLTKGLARDLGPRGITVNQISPGPIDTDMNPAHSSGAEGQRDLTILGRYGATFEIAAVASFLASTESAFITAADIAIDGGTNS